MNLKDKMDLRILAINAHNIYIDEFSLEDDDYIDYRAVRGKERALNNRIKKMSEMTGVDEEKIYHIVVNSIQRVLINILMNCVISASLY